MAINHILLDLEVIKQLEDYDKLGVLTLPGSTKLCVDSFGYRSAITRWYNNYNRETSISYVEQLTNNIEKTSDFIISGQHNEEGETLREAIDGALIGLEKLKLTYISDSIIVARIILIINKLKTLSKNLKNFTTNTYNFINEIENANSDNSANSANSANNINNINDDNNVTINTSITPSY
jgi:hypothetical protein